MNIMDLIKVAFFDLGGTLVGNERDWIPIPFLDNFIFAAIMNPRC